MGGRMWAESDGAGHGSTFYFTIESAIAQMAPARARDFVGVQPELAGKRILIVDDNATNRRVLGLQTGKWGMVSRNTESPQEALRWLADGENFDLAILDMHMPEMDGLELAGKIRAMNPTLPLMLFSSLGRREAGDKDGLFSAYLAKPIRQSHLYDALVGLLVDGDAPKPAPTAAKSGIDPGMAARHPLRVLLAEDNVVNQKLALRLLQQMGYRADLASNGIGSHRVRRTPDLRCDIDGRADARNGRTGSIAPDLRALQAFEAAAHRRDDRQCDAGRPRDVHRSRHGRLPHQADPRRPAGRGTPRRSRTEGPLT